MPRTKAHGKTEGYVLLDALVALLIAAVAAAALFSGLAAPLGRAGALLDRVATEQAARNASLLVDLEWKSSGRR